MELPSPFAGTVEALLVEPGQPVPVGTPIIAIATARRRGRDRAAGRRPAAAGALIGEAGPDGRIATLVGYGPRPGAARRRPRRGGPATAPAPAAPVAAAYPIRRSMAALLQSRPALRHGRQLHSPAPRRRPCRSPSRPSASSPATSASTCAPSPAPEPAGVITRDDVRAAAAASNVTFAGQNVPTRADDEPGCAASRSAASAGPPRPRWWPAPSPRRTSRSSSPSTSRRRWRCATGCGPLASTPTSR